VRGPLTVAEFVRIQLRIGSLTTSAARFDDASSKSSCAQVS
jgi:hypothetical protein